MRFVRSAALALENDVNPVRERAARVAEWLNAAATLWQPADLAMTQGRVAELIVWGFKNFDALHVTSAEEAGAALLVTVDDRLLAAAARHAAALRTRVCGVLECLKELPT